MLSKPISILLVEDSEDDYILTRDALREVQGEPYRLTWEADPESALRSLHGLSPDVMLVDWGLGVMNGLEFIRRAREQGARMPAILLTGYRGANIEEEAIAAGVSDYLEKSLASGPLLDRTIRFAIERQTILNRLEEGNEALERRIAERTAELREANSRLIEEQALLRQVIESMPVGVWLVDDTGSIQMGNAAGKDVWRGAMEEDGERFDPSRVTWEEGARPKAPESWAALQAVRRGEVTLNQEVEVRCPDGSRRVVLNSAVPLRANGGEITGGIIIHTDITARKQIERELSEANDALRHANEALAMNNQLLERMFSSIHLLFAYLDRNFNFIRVNRRYAEADGRSVDFFPGKNHFELYPGDEIEAVFRRVVESGVPYFTQARPFVYPDHPERGVSYWDWLLQPVIEPDGAVSGLILSLLDVTEAQNARMQLEHQAYLLENISDAIIAAGLDLRLTAWNRAAEAIFGWERGEVLEKNVFEVLSPDFDLAELPSLAEQVQEQGFFAGQTDVMHRDGRRIPVETHISVLSDTRGAPSGYVAILHDITRRRAAEEQASKLHQRLAVQAELTRLMAATHLDVQKMLAILASRTAELLGDACVVTQITDDGRRLIPVAFHHMDPDGLRFLREVLPPVLNYVGQGFSGIAAQTGRTVLVPVVSQEQARARVNPDTWPYLERFGVHSVLITPIIIDDRVMGTLGVTRDRPGRPYTPDDQLFLEAIAGRAAQWIANAGLYEDVRRELAERRRVEAELSEIQRRLQDGAESERLQLARELHDGPIQELYGLEFQLHALSDVIPGGGENEDLTALQASIQRIIGSLRAVTMELRPPTLTRVGLGAAIRSHCEGVQKLQPGLNVVYELDSEKPPAPKISERVRLALFRIVQVTVTNVVRHAQATELRLRLAIRENEVELIVADDGKGFNVPSRWVELARQGHLGLLGVRERVDALGGTMEVKSVPGKGATVRVVVPLEG